MAHSLEANGLNRSGKSQPLTDGTGKLSIATRNRVTPDRGRFGSGSRASAIVKLIGTDSCQTPHTGWVAEGGSRVGQGVVLGKRLTDEAGAAVWASACAETGATM